MRSRFIVANVNPNTLFLKYNDEHISCIMLFLLITMFGIFLEFNYSNASTDNQKDNRFIYTVSSNLSDSNLQPYSIILGPINSSMNNISSFTEESLDKEKFNELEENITENPLKRQPIQIFL